MCAAGTWLVVLRDFLRLHPWNPMLRLVWVKAHVGFRGNELADGLAKWAAHAFPPATPPTFRRSLTHNGTVVVGRAPKAALKSLIPSHEHRDISISASFDWVRGTSWFGILPFKWVSGTLVLSGYQFYTDVSDYHCHLCDSPHPRDPLSQVALCSRFLSSQDSMIRAWPPPFTAMVRDWWISASRDISVEP